MWWYEEDFECIMKLTGIQLSAYSDTLYDIAVFEVVSARFVGGGLVHWNVQNIDNPNKML